MAFSRFVPNKANLQKVLDSAARKITGPRAAQVLAVAKSTAPDLGDAQSTLRYTVAGNMHQTMEARVGSNAQEVLYAEEGTPPHIIRPRGNYPLKFPGTNGFAGKTVRTSVVYHPGTKGTHFLRSAGRNVIGRRG